MTDKQLHVLLDGMLDELADAIAIAETRLAIFGNQKTSNETEYIALAALRVLHDSWSNRVTILDIPDIQPPTTCWSGDCERIENRDN